MTRLNSWTSPYVIKHESMTRIPGSNQVAVRLEFVFRWWHPALWWEVVHVPVNVSRWHPAYWVRVVRVIWRLGHEQDT